jgi:hypothetical protein
MSYRKLGDQAVAVAVAAALGEIDVRACDLVLIMRLIGNSA